MADRELVGLDEATPELEAPISTDFGLVKSLKVSQSAYILERATPQADIAGWGQFWVLTATPNLPMFTNDGSTDFQLATLTGTETLSAKGIDLGTNTLTGSIAEFDAALQSDTFVFTSEIGSVVQAFDSDLSDIAALAVTDSNIMVGDGSNWIVESGATARASLGAGVLDNVVEDTAPQLGGDLDLQTNGFTIALTADVDVVLGDVCIIDGSGEAAIGDADILATADTVLFMAAATIAANNSGAFYVPGSYVSGLTGITVGATYYLSLTGTSTNTITTSRPGGAGDIVRVVGVGLTTTVLWFQPSSDYATV